MGESITLACVYVGMVIRLVMCPSISVTIVYGLQLREFKAGDWPVALDCLITLCMVTIACSSLARRDWNWKSLSR